MPLIFRPAFWSCRIACSRPAPGPLTFTSISIIPLLRASAAAFSAARPAAKGVLLRAPLKPTVPADAQEMVSPLVSVMVTIVLLNVALMWATPLVTPLRIFFFGPGLPAAAAFACSPMILLYLCRTDQSVIRPSPCGILTPAHSQRRCFSIHGQVAHATIYLPSSLTPFLPATVLRG